MRHLSLVQSLSRLQVEQRYTDEVLLDHFGLAFTRGTLVEVAGGSGKTSLALSLLSKLTRTGEICAVVDASNSFDPCTAFLAGAKNENLLWVQCHGDMEKAFMAADYLVQAKGFGAIWLNLNDMPPRQLRLVPRTYWYRYRNRIKETPTIMLVTAADHITGSASQRSFAFSRERTVWSGTGRYKLLREFHLSCNSRNGSGMLEKNTLDSGTVEQRDRENHPGLRPPLLCTEERFLVQRLIKIEVDYTDV